MCNNPVEKVITNGTRQTMIKYPCGNCLGCRIDKQKIWQTRAEYELARMKSASFVTFTYDEFNINKNEGMIETLRRKDATDLIKRLRETAKTNFTYIGCGEYGGQLGRPHMHFIFFGLDNRKFQKIFKKIWKNGYVKTLPVKAGAIRYITKYFFKETGGEAEQKYDKTGRERPFMTRSKGLGKAIFYKHREEIEKKGYLQLGKRKVPIPTYYKKLLSSFDDKNATIQKQNAIKEVKRQQTKAKELGFNPKTYQEEMAVAREMNLLQKARKEGIAIDDLKLKLEVKY